MLWGIILSNFVHLHTHSEYSKLDGTSRVEDLINKALEYEQKAVAITDHGHMGSVPELYTISKKKGIKPIIGQEFYVSDNVEIKERNENRYHLVLLAFCLLYTSPSPRDRQKSRMPSSA